jgi:hypothetical protein
MDASVGRQLDTGRRSVESRDFEAALRRKIVRQDEAVQAVVDLPRERSRAKALRAGHAWGLQQRVASSRGRCSAEDRSCSRPKFSRTALRAVDQPPDAGSSCATHGAAERFRLLIQDSSPCRARFSLARRPRGTRAPDSTVGSDGRCRACCRNPRRRPRCPGCAFRSFSLTLEIRASRLPGRPTIPRCANRRTISPLGAHPSFHTCWSRCVHTRGPHRIRTALRRAGRMAGRMVDPQEAPSYV